MSEKNNHEEGIELLNQKLSEIEQHLELMQESMRDLNGAVDMLVRFSMTAKAFMELSISQGLIDPYELNRIASIYEHSYSANLEVREESNKYGFKDNRFSI